MQIKYYETAWRDISNSPGWFGKLCLLALVNFIPIFGQIVTYGYLYGWAREIAWGVYAPMPQKLICNDDGKFWRRGWFYLVLSFVFALIPGIITGIGQSMQGSGIGALYSDAPAAVSSATVLFGQTIHFIGFLATLFMAIFTWIAAMRMSIYDRLSAGFQIGKLWKMFRHDTGGIMRIFGMYLLVGAIVGFIVGILATVLAMIIFVAGFAGLASSGYTVDTLQYMTDEQAIYLFAQMMGSVGIIGVLGLLLVTYASIIASLFLGTLVARAMGYWTSQFDVPRWRGQDDPMPFELQSPPINPGGYPGM